MLHMTRSCRRAIFSMCICISTFLAAAAYSESWDSEGNDRDVPHRIVVKLSSDRDIPASGPNRTVAATGIQAFDAVGRNHEVKSQRLLFPTEAAKNHPRSLKNVMVLIFPDGTDIEKTLAEYRRLDDVVYAHPDYRVELYEAPDDSLYVHQWYLNNTGQPHYEIVEVPGDSNDYIGLYSGTPDADIDFQEVFDNPPDNTTTVVVGVIDTGVDLDHPELAGHIYVNPGEIPDNGVDDDHNGYIDDVHGWDVAGDIPFFVPDNDPTDEMGHGTHCSGIIGAVTNNGRGVAGIAQDVRILPVCCYFSPFISTFAEGIVYAADMGVDVMSMSFGAPFSVDVLEDAISYASARGAILCVAAGNDGYEQVNYPAGYPETMAIAASTSDDRLAVFSTFGDHLTVCAPGQMILSLRADDLDPLGETEPGVHIIDSMYYIASGTSMACPVTAGIAAYLRSVSPGLTHAAAKTIIEQTADDILDPYGTGENFPGFDIYTGWGRVNLARALEAVPRVRTYISDPLRYQVLTGTVDIAGIADGAEMTDYILEYGEGMVPESWTMIAASSTPVTDGILASWNTGGLTGLYTLRLRAGEFNEYRVTVYVVNDRVAIFDHPAALDTIKDRAIVSGTAVCPDFREWVLEYGAGTSPSAWDTIDVSAVPGTGRELITWRCGDVPDGWYTLKLSVFSTSGLEAETSVPIYVKSLFTDPLGWRVHFDTTLTRVPTYGDFDDDGRNEIIVGTSTGLYFFNPDGTPKTDGMPSLPAYDFRTAVAVGNLDGDGIDDFVAISMNPGILYGFPSSAPSFEAVLPDGTVSGSELFLKDVNGDGRDEIHYVRNNLVDPVPAYVYHPDGSPWSCAFPVAYVLEAYIPADLNGDGICEIYACGGDTLVQLDTCGQIVDYFVFEGQGYFHIVHLSAVDIDGDHLAELIAMGWFQENIWTFTSNVLMYAFDDGMTPMPGWPHDTQLDPVTASVSHPLFTDLDNDGELEYVSLGDGIYAWNLDGTVFAPHISSEGRMAAPPDQTAMTSGLMLIDADGDGYTDIGAALKPGNVLYSTYDGQGVGVWDRNGDVLDGWPIDVAFHLQGYIPPMGPPIFGDLDDDGVVDMMTTTVENDLVFTELSGTTYLPGRFTCPHPRYNRSLDYTYIPSQAGCGDPSGDGAVNIGDAVYLIGYIFKQGAPPVPECVGDADGDSMVNIADAVYLVNFIFKSGPPPVIDCCP